MGKRSATHGKHGPHIQFDPEWVAQQVANELFNPFRVGFFLLILIPVAAPTSGGLATG